MGARGKGEEWGKVCICVGCYCNAFRVRVAPICRYSVLVPGS